MTTTENQTGNSPRPIALITGAAKRIGRVLALDLARNGWDIAIHYNSSKSDAEALAKEISSFGAVYALVQGDLANAEEVNNLFPSCIDQLGAPVCLINNASLFENDSIQSLTEQSWDMHLNINLRAPVLLAQALAKYLPVGENGNIINIIDQKVRKLTPHFYSYTISKSGLWTATQTMAQALAPEIRVNAIGPGPILQSIHQTEEEFAKQYTSTPLKRGAQPEEIASAVRFILDAPAMTGQMIMLDGGQHMSWKKPNKPQKDI